MFRRERPQKGRQRQFHQIGCELLGVWFPLLSKRRKQPFLVLCKFCHS
jgi:hypothetical protein